MSFGQALYGGIASQITVESLKIRNRQVNLLKILIQPSQPTSVPNETNAALAITVQNRSGANLGNCQDIYFEAGIIETIFSPDAYLDAANACGILFDAVSGAKSVHHPKRPVKDMIVNGGVATLTLVLADKLLPFIECQFQDVTFEKSVVASQTTSHTSLRAGAVSIDLVSESSHPNIVSTYTSKNGDDFDDLSALSIKLTTQLISASGPNEFLIALNGVRIVLLRQSLNEILQYISSPNYGIGLVLHCFETEKGSSSHASPAPQELKVSIHNSSIILP